MLGRFESRSSSLIISSSRLTVHPPKELESPGKNKSESEVKVAEHLTIGQGCHEGWG